MNGLLEFENLVSRTLTEILAGTLNYNAATEDKKGPLGRIAWMKDFFGRQVIAGKTIAEVSEISQNPSEASLIATFSANLQPALWQ